jgi:hypothetical protein
MKASDRNQINMFSTESWTPSYPPSLDVRGNMIRANPIGIRSMPDVNEQWTDKRLWRFRTNY